MKKMWLLVLISLIRVEGFTNSQSAVLDFAIPRFEECEKLKDGVKFVDLSIEDAGIIYDVGKPKLPVIRKFIEIPEGADVSVEIKAGAIQELPLRLPVYPNQPPWLKIPGYRPEFTWDRDYYERDEFLPHEKAKITEIGEIRGHRVALLEVYPVSYNPAKNIVRFAKDIQVKIRWDGANWGATYAKLKRYSSPIYDYRLKDLIVNYNYYNSLTENRKPKTESLISYLIIIPDSWESAITPLAEWKRQKGYYVQVASLSEVGGGDTTAVRNYIKNAYDTWTVPPSFVLLVGDIDSIGHFIGGTLNNPATDLYYGTMDTSDYFPDIDVSRLSITSETELEEFIEKTIRYEKNEWTQGTDWCNKSYFIASTDANNHEIAEGTHSYCMEKCRAYGMICDSLWGFDGTGTPITTALNEGRSWVMYSGHGSITSWQGPSFSTIGVHNLSNLDKVPFVGTFACKSGRYQVAECFSESWIRSGYNGAIADFASSVYSYWEEDDILQRRMFDAAFDSGFTWAMGIINKSKLLFYEYYGDFTPMASTRRYFEMYNLMGDGSVDICWDTPYLIVYKEYEVDDSSAHNPNGYWESGEATNLIVTLENKGVRDATGILAKLRTNNSYVTIIDSSVNFGDIPAGELKIGSPYRLFLHPSTPIGEKVDFELHITGMSREWTDAFTVQTGLPGVMFADHNIGNVKFTVTCQGICGKESMSGAGSGFCYPVSGNNWLHIGSLWTGNSASYVVNRDYYSEGTGDWKVILNPDGKLRMGTKKYSDQDGWARYDDSGHLSPCGIIVTQKSWAWEDTSCSDFVIMQYTIENNGSFPVNGLFVGQFMDFDLDENSSSDNEVGTDSIHRLVYQWSNSHTEYVGISVLAPAFASNLSAISYSNYISPDGYIPDSLKIKFLDGTLSFPSSDGARDWSVVASTGPFDLEVGENTIIAVAILGGDSLKDLKHNADMAQEKYDSLMEGKEDLRVTINDLRLTIYPNPFTKQTVICYSLNANRNDYTINDLRLTIYDLAGRLVREFPIPESRFPNPEIIWDGKDSHNKKLSSGVYFCRLELGEYRKVQKLILLR